MVGGRDLVTIGWQQITRSDNPEYFENLNAGYAKGRSDRG